MARLFEEHIQRTVRSLNGHWRFLPDPEDLGEQMQWYFGLHGGETVMVPSVWNEEKGLLTYSGAVWYEKQFYSREGCIRLCFDGVLTEARVWLDGVYLGSHYGGFTAFDFIVPQVSQGQHTLVLRVDNRFDAHSIPQKRVDWYPYGGILRDVRVERLEGLCVLENRLEYTLSPDMHSAVCHFELNCYQAEAGDASPLHIALDGTTVYEDTVALPAGRHSIRLPEFCVENVRLWELGKPELYTVSIRTATDDLYDRVGFRKVEVSNGSILLNGKPIEIRGINRHEDYPGFGFAFPPSRMKYDLDLILDLGCNAVRGAHYPQSQLFVDYLDAKGILFWSEIPIWGGGFSKEALGDSLVLERGLEMHREMAAQYYNHPSILMWGLHNEIVTSTAEAVAMSQAYYTYLKAHGGNRLVVYATAQPMDDGCFAYTDVLCINKYFGWYEGDMQVWDTFLDTFCRHRDALGHGNKPVLISEFGAAALYGFHDAERSKWSEEYQAQVLTYCLELFHHHPAVVGSFVWQFSDMRTSPEMGFSRSRGFNNKGIVNEYRRPKAGYYAVQACFHKE